MHVYICIVSVCTYRVELLYLPVPFARVVSFFVSPGLPSCFVWSLACYGPHGWTDDHFVRMRDTTTTTPKTTTTMRKTTTKNGNNTSKPFLSGLLVLSRRFTGSASGRNVLLLVVVILVLVNLSCTGKSSCIATIFDNTKIHIDSFREPSNDINQVCVGSMVVNWTTKGFDKEKSTGDYQTNWGSFHNDNSKANEVNTNASTASFRTTTDPVASLPAKECLFRRGTQGRWVRDWDYANQAAPLVRTSWWQQYMQFVPTDDAPYRWETSWRWQDDLCPVEPLLSLEEWCRLCEHLRVDRVFVAGDSTNQAMFESLMNRIGVAVPRKALVYQRAMAVKCSWGVLRHRFARSDEAVEILDEPQFQKFLQRDNEDRLEGKGEKTDSVSSSSSSSSSRPAVPSTLFVLNYGVHFGPFNMRYYKRTTIKLWKWVEANVSPQDIVVFRNTVPGHDGCEPKNQTDGYRSGTRVVPFVSYDEWKQSIQGNTGSSPSLLPPPPYIKFGWVHFERFNQYWVDYFRNKMATNSAMTRQARPGHSEQGICNKRFTALFLNVFNMTVLRRDGHVGGTDCLHYIVPGPTDWWVHSLYSQLQDLVRIRRDSA